MAIRLIDKHYGPRQQSEPDEKTLAGNIRVRIALFSFAGRRTSPTAVIAKNGHSGDDRDEFDRAPHPARKEDRTRPAEADNPTAPFWSSMFPMNQSGEDPPWLIGSREATRGTVAKTTPIATPMPTATDSRGACRKAGPEAPRTPGHQWGETKGKGEIQLYRVENRCLGESDREAVDLTGKVVCPFEDQHTHADRHASSQRINEVVATFRNPRDDDDSHGGSYGEVPDGKGVKAHSQ